MAAKSCREINALVAANAILQVLRDSRDPVGITEIAKRAVLSVDVVFRQVGTMATLRWIEKIGDGYVLGLGLALMWARRKALAEIALEKANKELSDLTGGDHE